MAALASTISRPNLLQAIDRNELSVAFQPQLTADGQSVASVEALLRWRLPDGGFISPETAVAHAEREGLIDMVGLYVLQQACTAARAWPGLVLAVNISPTHFAKPGFVDDVARVLDATWFPANRLEIEIVESAAFDDPDHASRQIERLHAIGARVAMDDFGTGYSSLSYLRNLPLDCLKIDKSLVMDVSILVAVIQLARSFRLKTIAEGVEDEHLATLLRELGCDMAQGYHFARPMPLSRLMALEIK